MTTDPDRPTTTPDGRAIGPELGITVHDNELLPWALTIGAGLYTELEVGHAITEAEELELARPVAMRVAQQASNAGALPLGPPSTLALRPGDPALDELLVDVDVTDELLAGLEAVAAAGGTPVLIAAILVAIPNATTPGAYVVTGARPRPE